LVSRGGRAPRVPFGLKGWTDAADAIAVVLDVPREWPASGLGDLATVARQVPDASTLAPGALVVVLGDAAASDGLLARLKRPARVARALRASALLARGFRHIGGGVDAASGHDLAWGWVSPTQC
jgi:uncharacterized protein with von Willebrand factor type A (vWA) domain